MQYNLGGIKNLKQLLRETVCNKKLITYICFAFFVMWRIILIVQYEGWYAYDEIYHISSSNQQFYFSSEYFYAPYINMTIHFLSRVLGKAYYVYKLIPFCLSLVSIGLLLYVLYHLSEHIYSIIFFTFTICFHSIIIYNHLYIRTYVVDEAVLSLFVFLFYIISKEKVKWKKIILYIIYISTALGLTLMEVADWSSCAVTFFGLLALLLNAIFKKILPGLKKKKYFKYLILGSGIFLVLVECILIMFKSGVLESSLVTAVTSGIGYAYRGYPYFTRHFYIGGIGLLISVIALGYYIIKFVSDYSDNIIGIYCLGVIPFLCFNMVYYDCFPMRVYASYFPVFILLAFLFIDKLPVKFYSYLFAVTTAFLAVYESQPDMDWKVFLRAPYIVNETYFNDYGSLVEEANAEIQNGRHCICIWANEHHKAAFDVDAEEVIAFENSINQSNGYTEADLTEILQRLQSKEESYVVLVGPHCDYRSYLVMPEFMNTLFENYPYQKYEKDAYLFYIN